MENDFLKIAKQAAKEAGEIIQKYSSQTYRKNIKYGDVTDFATDADLKAEEKIISILTKDFHDHNIVAEESGKIIGIVTWLMHGLPKHQLCELDRIAVLPEYMGKGVARELFDALVKDAKSFYRKKKLRLRKLYLLTHADNTRAHKFYEKLGFKHETTLKQHYYKDKDEYVYSMFF